jgi:hypothetical protein
VAAGTNEGIDKVGQACALRGGHGGPGTEDEKNSSDFRVHLRIVMPSHRFFTPTSQTSSPIPGMMNGQWQKPH